MPLQPMRNSCFTVLLAACTHRFQETRSLGEVLHSFRRAAGWDFPYIDLQSPPRDDDPQPLDLKPLVDLGWGPRIPLTGRFGIS